MNSYRVRALVLSSAPGFRDACGSEAPGRVGVAPGRPGGCGVDSEVAGRDPGGGRWAWRNRECLAGLTHSSLLLTFRPFRCLLTTCHLVKTDHSGSRSSSKNGPGGVSAEPERARPRTPGRDAEGSAASARARPPGLNLPPPAAGARHLHARVRRGTGCGSGPAASRGSRAAGGGGGGNGCRDGPPRSQVRPEVTEDRRVAASAWRWESAASLGPPSLPAAVRPRPPHPHRPRPTRPEAKPSVPVATPWGGGAAGGARHARTRSLRASPASAASLPDGVRVRAPRGRTGQAWFSAGLEPLRTPGAARPRAPLANVRRSRGLFGRFRKVEIASRRADAPSLYMLPLLTSGFPVVLIFMSLFRNGNAFFRRKWRALGKNKTQVKVRVEANCGMAELRGLPRTSARACGGERGRGAPRAGGSPGRGPGCCQWSDTWRSEQDGGGDPTWQAPRDAAGLPAEGVGLFFMS